MAITRQLELNTHRVTDDCREVSSYDVLQLLQCYSLELPSSLSSDGVGKLELGLGVLFFRNRRLSLSAGLGLGCLLGRRGRSWGRGRGGAAPRSVASPHRGRARPSCTPLSFVARHSLRPWPAAACRSPFALSTLARCPLPTNAASENRCRLQRAAYR